MLNKGHWMIIHIRVKKIRIWLPLPLYIIKEFMWQLVELADLIGTFGNKKLKEIKKALPVAVFALDCIGEGGRYDLVDIEAGGEDGEKVKIVVKVR